MGQLPVGPPKNKNNSAYPLKPAHPFISVKPVSSAPQRGSSCGTTNRVEAQKKLRVGASFIFHRFISAPRTLRSDTNTNTSTRENKHQHLGERRDTNTSTSTRENKHQHLGERRDTNTSTWENDVVVSLP